jgi:hypothetical protein
MLKFSQEAAVSIEGVGSRATGFTFLRAELLSLGGGSDQNPSGPILSDPTNERPTLFAMSAQARDASAKESKPETEQMSEQWGRQLEQRSLESAINVQNRLIAQKQQHRSDWLASLQELYDKVLNAEPKPAVALGDQEAARIKAIAEKSDGYVSGLNYGLVLDGKQYTVRPDGTVLMQDEGIPTSQQEKRDMLKNLGRQIAYLSSSDSQAIAYRDSLVQQLKELQGGASSTMVQQPRSEGNGYIVSILA